MYPPGIVEHVDVFEYETMSMIDVQYVESVEPLSLDESMERLNTGIIPWIRLRWVASENPLSLIPVSDRSVLYASVAIIPNSG